MPQNDNNLSPGAGATTGGTTASTGSSGSTTETRSPSTVFTGSSDFSDTSRPTGSTTTSSSGFTGGTTTVTRPAETGTDSFETSGSQEVGGSLSYEDRSRSRPNTAVVVGAAIAGAITGGAIPFMLAGRKSSQRSASVEADYRTTATASFDRDTSFKR